MKSRIVAYLFFAAAVMPCLAQSQASPEIYRSRASLARCKSVASLRRIRNTIGSSDKLTELVFIARLLMLSSHDSTAARKLLELTPSSEDEQDQLMQISDPPDETTIEEADMRALGQVYERWPSLMARAALLAPDYLEHYVGYLRLAPNDIHSDFTGNAVQVCRKLPSRFRAAISALSKKDREFIAAHVFDANACKPIFVSEAE